VIRGRRGVCAEREPANRRVPERNANPSCVPW
jgi:hypothetical protein